MTGIIEKDKDQPVFNWPDHFKKCYHTELGWSTVFHNHFLKIKDTTCVICSKEIPSARLEIIPNTKTCSTACSKVLQKEYQKKWVERKKKERKLERERRKLMANSEKLVASAL